MFNNDLRDPIESRHMDARNTEKPNYREKFGGGGKGKGKGRRPQKGKGKARRTKKKKGKRQARSFAIQFQ